MSIKIATKSAAYIAARKVLGDHRKVFDSAGDAVNALRTIFMADGFPQEFPVVAAGVGLVDLLNTIDGEPDENGNPTLVFGDTTPPFADWPEVYHSDGVLTCVSFIGTRSMEDENGKQVNGAIGFSVYPLHSIDSIQSDEAGVAWLWKVAEKEGSHVALRGLRNVADSGIDALAAAALKMPLTVSEYVEESASEAGDTEAFDKMWVKFRKILAEQPATAAMMGKLGSKGEVLKCIRSKDYATENFGDLESMGAFVFIATKMAEFIDVMRDIAVANGEDFGIDSTEMRGWIAKRDEYKLQSRKAAGDLTKVDFSQFNLGIAAPTAPATQEGANG